MNTAAKKEILREVKAQADEEERKLQRQAEIINSFDLASTGELEDAIEDTKRLLAHIKQNRLKQAELEEELEEVENEN